MPALPLGRACDGAGELAAASGGLQAQDLGVQSTAGVADASVRLATAAWLATYTDPGWPPGRVEILEARTTPRATPGQHLHQGHSRSPDLRGDDNRYVSGLSGDKGASGNNL